MVLARLKTHAPGAGASSTGATQERSTVVSIARPESDRESQLELRESEPSGIGDPAAAAELERELRGLPPSHPPPDPPPKAPTRSTSPPPTSYGRNIGPSWVAQMRGVKVLVVAAALGIKPTTTRPKWTAPCATCLAPKQHTKSRDRRGAMGVLPNGTAFYCFQCEETIDALDLIALNLCGKRLRDAGERGVREVREYCESKFGVSSGNRTDWPPRTVSQVKPANDVYNTEEPELVVPHYPSPESLAALNSQLVRIDEVECVLTCLQSRPKLDVGAVAELTMMARAIPDDGPPLPSWAYYGSRSWRETGHRLVTPFFDAAGFMRTVSGRYVGKDKELPKSLPPRGYDRGGLVMACPLARRMLQYGTHPSQWPTDDMGWWPVSQPLELIIAEGEIDVLFWATEFSDADVHAPGVIGVVNGSWKQAHADRIPSGTQITVATDDDADGDKYAAQILKALVGREDLPPVIRWRADEAL